MKFSAALLAASAFTLLGATAAQAEDYHAHQAPAASALSRAEVQSEAVRAAQAPNQNVVAGSRVIQPMADSRSRAEVVAEAVRAANAPDQNVVSGSRVNSTVVSTMPNRADTRLQAGAGADRTAQ